MNKRIENMNGWEVREYLKNLKAEDVKMREERNDRAVGDIQTRARLIFYISSEKGNNATAKESAEMLSVKSIATILGKDRKAFTNRLKEFVGNSTFKKGKKVDFENWKEERRIQKVYEDWDFAKREAVKDDAHGSSMSELVLTEKYFKKIQCGTF